MQPAASILAGVLPVLLRRAPMTQEKVDFAWRTATGAAVARATRVRLEGGVLVVSADDPRWAGEVKRAQGTILARLRDLLGADNIRHIHVDRG